ncbi:MAG: HpcH/HpaI aldolase/citrate lyase family protein [Campylobacterota bacterium]|nr:HpcH/HpaI aldolase/citrate lyase family protein [Campylobacterota bacterium]
MFREFDYTDLGGTLYTPAINKKIVELSNGIKFPFLKSIVFCLEDAIKNSDLKFAMQNIQFLLDNIKQTNIKVFIRPRDEKNLTEILELRGIQKIDGFALAKFGTYNMKNYFDILNHKKIKTKYHIMPVLESKDMFDISKLKQIRELLLTQEKHNILTLRVGGEDMFRFMNLKKSCKDSIHDFHISSKIFADIFSVFKPYSFNITAPVYNCLENEDIFKAEVLRDIKEGFFGKTIIHPNQALIINQLYKVSQGQYDEAKAILDKTNEAIFRFKDKMCEPSAHSVWAETILKLEKIYGMNDTI